MSPHDLSLNDLIYRYLIAGPIVQSADIAYVTFGDPFYSFEGEARAKLKEFIQIYEPPKGLRLGLIIALKKTLIDPFTIEVERSTEDKAKGLINGYASWMPKLFEQYCLIAEELESLGSEEIDMRFISNLKVSCEDDSGNLIKKKIDNAIEAGFASSQLAKFLEGFARGLSLLSDDCKLHQYDTTATQLYGVMYPIEDILSDLKTDELRFDYVSELMGKEMIHDLDSFRKICVRLRKAARDFELSRTSG